MTEEKKCYIHNTPTGLSCASCGKPICTKCMVSAHIGYKCRDCGQRNITHIEKITLKQYILGSLVGLAVGIATGYVWNVLSVYGLFINLLVAYAIGFCVSKSISKAIGNKIGIKIQILAGIIVLISMAYNPIFLVSKGFISDFSVVPAVINITLYNISCIKRILALILAVWAAIRHFKI
ncbi:MAG: hypothetical protein A2104_06640 [Candidatus Melainabacteria bacterium GWF2_32_7]|nr:MAG: hypothetical protein A2104_06640 [Candidatus Melainabacteria bacterium GWF2_32_7]